MKSFEIIGNHFKSLDGAKGKGKRRRISGYTFKDFHLAILSRARTHDTKRFPGYGGACLKANSLPPTSDIYIYIYIYIYYKKHACKAQTWLVGWLGMEYWFRCFAAFLMTGAALFECTKLYLSARGCCIWNAHGCIWNAQGRIWSAHGSIWNAQRCL